MRRVAVIGWLILVSMAAATPRWGDDFDWVGEQRVRNTVVGISASHDTIYFQLDDGVDIYRQLDTLNFQWIGHLQLPIRHVGREYYYNETLGILSTFTSSQFPINGRILYGLPDLYAQWRGNNLEVLPFRVTGLNRRRFPALDAVRSSTGNDSLAGTYTISSPSLTPILYRQFLFHADSIYQRDSTGYFTLVASDTLATDWSFAGDFAYSISTESVHVYPSHTVNHLSVWSLEGTTPVKVNSVPLGRTRGFTRVINDTLLILYGDQWQVWSLADRASPTLLSTARLPMHLYWLEETPSDSTYFGWGGRSQISGVSASMWTTFVRLSFPNGLRAPVILDSLHHEGYLPPNPGQIAKTPFGRLWMADSINWLTTKLFSMNVTRVGNQTRWNFHWPDSYHPIPSLNLFLPRYLRNRLKSVNRTAYTYSYVLDIDTVNLTHQIYPRVGLDFIRENDVISKTPVTPELFLFMRTDFRTGRVDTLLTREPIFTETINYVNERVIITTANTGSYRFKVYHLFGDSAIYDDFFASPILNSNVAVFRDSTALVYENNWNMLYWYRKVDGVWQRQPDMIDTLRSNIKFASNCFVDTTCVFGQTVYYLPPSGAPRVLRSLQSAISDFPPWSGYSGFDRRYLLTQSSTYTIIAPYPAFVSPPTYYEGLSLVFENRGDSLVYAGSILSHGAPVLVGNLAVYVDDDVVSSYRLPPLSAVPDQSAALPTQFSLSSPYPNPFNSTVQFRFELPKAGITQYLVYDALGREVWREELGTVPAGRYYARWDGKNHSGIAVSSGMYFLRFTSGDFHSIKKIVMVK